MPISLYRQLHSTWLVNSAAHMWGMRPYDKEIEPRESNGVALATFGEGYHNYHHTFPWDYSTGEFNWRYTFNISTFFIEFFAWCGLAYDLKSAPRDLVKKRQDRTGDNSDYKYNGYSLYDWIFTLALLSLPLFLPLVVRTVMMVMM